MILVAAFQGVSAVVVPPLRGILSKSVSTEDQGKFSLILAIMMMMTVILKQNKKCYSTSTTM